MKFALSVLLTMIGFVALAAPGLSTDIQPLTWVEQKSSYFHPVVETTGEALLASIKKPATLDELLQNIKFAIENDLLLQEDFYSDENLKRFFNTSQIKRVGDPPVYVDVVAFNEQPPNQRHYLTVYLPARLDDQGRRSDDGKLRAGMAVSGGVPPFPIEVVEGVFGAATDIRAHPASGYTMHPQPLMPKTHKLGNVGIMYRLDQATANASVSIVTNGNGTVNIFNVGVGRK